MNQKLSQIFKNIKEIGPSKGLESLIMQKISLEREKQIKRRLFLSYTGFGASVLATFYALIAYGNSLLRSEFWSMASLIFSDLMVVAGNWKTYAYSLLETLPVMNIIAILVPLLALFISFNFYLSFRNKMKYIHSHGSFKFVV